MLTYYLFDQLPGVWEKWTLAVLAVSLNDAREYINVHHGRGHYRGKTTQGKVNADCGALTTKAEEILAQHYLENK